MGNGFETSSSSSSSPTTTEASPSVAQRAPPLASATCEASEKLPRRLDGIRRSQVTCDRGDRPLRKRVAVVVR
ncbi:unnamed protein product [Heligmosomoides polygyrus]|uniref:Uncharacterized protein n=1 Tax=Heligmosomoides polygyrus TaxID=6339 RepID=A0A183FUP4_HELPZ|nr:unnamed protein product [Heligmosomoides polygyrus]